MTYLHNWPTFQRFSVQCCNVDGWRTHGSDFSSRVFLGGYIIYIYTHVVFVAVLCCSSSTKSSNQLPMIWHKQSVTPTFSRWQGAHMAYGIQNSVRVAMPSVGRAGVARVVQHRRKKNLHCQSPWFELRGQFAYMLECTHTHLWRGEKSPNHILVMQDSFEWNLGPTMCMPTSQMIISSLMPKAPIPSVGHVQVPLELL